MTKYFNKLKFSFIRIESNGTYTLFLEARPELFGKEFDIYLNKELKLVLNGDQSFITEPLPLDLYSSISKNQTDVFFVDHLTQPLLHMKLQPIEIRK